MKDMNMSELEVLNGGVAPVWILIGSSLVGASIASVINGWPDFKQGFQEAYWHQQEVARQ